nr:nitroreductase/quinone reductase family protein [Nocardia asiatica]
MALKTVLGRTVRAVNGGVVALLDVPLLGKLLGKGFVVITYVGRRSGRTFSTPVNYWRKGDELVIGVAMPDKKSWWRNFTDEGGPITLHLDGADRRGHAVAQRDERGRVFVKVRLDDAS